MKLGEARLCLDCDEVHEAQSCPACGSETFAYLSRWVPAPEPPRRAATPPSTENADVYRALLDKDAGVPNRQLLKRGLLGLTAIGIAGWAWRNTRGNGGKTAPSEPPPPSS